MQYKLLYEEHNEREEQNGLVPLLNAASTVTVEDTFHETKSDAKVAGVTSVIERVIKTEVSVDEEKI